MKRVGYYAMWVEPTEDGQYRATEPNTDHDNWGRGDTPAQAIAHYCELMDGGQA